MVSQSRFVVPDRLLHWIRKLHPEIKQKIRAAFDAIAANPTAGKALIKELKGLRSFRVGRIRIIYKISSPLRVEIVAVGPRRTIYEETARMVRRRSG